MTDGGGIGRDRSGCRGNVYSKPHVFSLSREDYTEGGILIKFGRAGFFRAYLRERFCQADLGKHPFTENRLGKKDQYFEAVASDSVLKRPNPM